MRTQKHEILCIVEKIKANNLKCKYQFEEINMESIVNNLHNVDYRDRPDALIELDNIVYIIEHFQISIYKNNKNKGDPLAISINSNTIKNEISFKPNLNNLIKNLDYCLKKHSLSFEKYLEVAKEKYPDKDYKIILLIEDKSNDIIHCSSMNDMCILDIYETVEIMLSYPQINGIISFNISPLGDYIFAADRQSIQKKHPDMIKAKNLEITMSYESASCLKSSIEKILKSIGKLNESTVFSDEIKIEKY